MRDDALGLLIPVGISRATIGGKCLFTYCSLSKNLKIVKQVQLMGIARNISAIYFCSFAVYSINKSLSRYLNNGQKLSSFTSTTSANEEVGALSLLSL